MHRLHLLLAAALAVPAGCADTPTRADAPSKESAQDGKATGAEEAKKAPEDPNELTDEDRRLMAADPKELSPEENRKRAHAFRKQIMQNPDSEAAKALEDARASVVAGEVDPFAKPKDEDAGVVIELPPHLRQQDQTYGKPAQ
jgi:hypothetical protein